MIYKKRIIRLVFCIFILIVSTIYPHSAFCQEKEDFTILDNWIKWTHAGSMLISHLNEQAFQYLDQRELEISRLTTADDWMKRQEKVRETLLKIVGPFPERTPLNPKVTGILKKNGFRVEKIVYESMPGFYVTAGLFIPDGIKGKRPAVIHVSGHTSLAFREPTYQVVILNLVRKGFIVFAIDPVAQGERDQYLDLENKKSVIEMGVPSHSYAGSQCFVSGSSLARYFTWDIIRGIDYLETRKEVDMQNIGIAGRSGGGTQSAYASAFDHRIKAAAPEAFITSQRRLLESVGVQDAEQNLYHAIMNGIDHADFIEVRAPKPMMIVTTTRDYFSIQGARETYNEARNAYAAFGEPGNLIMAEDDYIHGSTKKNRESVYWFFQKFLELPGNSDEETIEPLTADELKVTSTGQVSSSLGGETVFSLNRKETQILLDKLEKSRQNVTSHLPAVRENAKKISGYTSPVSSSEPHFCGRYQRNGYSIEMVVLKAEGDCVIPLLLFVPNLCEKTGSIIYLHPEGKQKVFESGSDIEKLVARGFVVAAPDISGTGETKNTTGRYLDHLLDYNTLLTGRSLPGIRAGDIIRTADFLRGLGYINVQQIAAVATGDLGSALLHAAAFDESIRHVILLQSPLSYRSMVMNEYYKMPFSTAVPGALAAYDLPDLMACIAPRTILLSGSSDHMLVKASEETIKQELAFPVSVYSQKNIPGNLIILPGSMSLDSMINLCFK